MAKTPQKFLGQTDEELLVRYKLERDNAFNFRKPAVCEWRENENLLYAKKPETLSKRSNIMVQLMAGFEDTLLSKIKNPVLIVFKPQESADVEKARKVTSAWELESSVGREDWEYKNLLVKKLAMVSGRGILKIYATYPYRHRFEPIDHYDFLVDPLCNGMTLESARYIVQENIIKSKYQLENGKYDKAAVKRLIESYADNNSEAPDNEDQEKANRFVVLGMNYSEYFGAGDATYRLSEWYTTINGVRACIVLDPNKQIIIKKTLLSEMTGKLIDGDEYDFWPFESWAYYPDLFNFWSPAPMSRVRELFILRNISLNQMFDNNESKNKPMRAIDPKIYTNPLALKYERDKIIQVAAGRDPSKGIYTIPTEDIIEPKQFNDILEELSGKITGVTADGAGSSNTDKVGIYYGDQQSQEKRMTLFELSYGRCHLRSGQKYIKYLSTKLDEKASIKILGLDGVEKEDLTQEDLADFDVSITGGMSQAANDALDKKAKNEFLKANVNNQNLNQKFALELGLSLNGFNQDDIKRALQVSNEDEHQVVRAANDVQKVLLGKKLKPYLKAEVSYMQKIFDTVYETEMKKEHEETLMQYLKEIQPIVVRNMVSKARHMMAMKGMLALPSEFAAAPEEGPSPENPNNPNLDNQMGLDQSKVQSIPGDAQAML